jgi:co-chaperonin GroES (HSP10)
MFMARTERAEQKLVFEPKLESNDAGTSTGEELWDEELCHELPLDGFVVTGVPDDVILLEDIVLDNEERTDDGLIIKNGLVFSEEAFRDQQGGNVFKACKVVMVGDNVKYTKQGYTVVLEQKAGIPVTFAGSKYIFAREKQVFMYVEKQETK